MLTFLLNQSSPLTPLLAPCLRILRWMAGSFAGILMGKRDVRYLIAILLTSAIAKLQGQVVVCHILGYPINPKIRKARNDCRLVQTF